MSLPPSANPLVSAVAGALLPKSSSAVSDLVKASNLPGVVTFVGFVGEKVSHPSSSRDWRVLFLDMALDRWLLVEEDGIVDWEQITDDKIPHKKCDVIWVKKDAAVGNGRGSLSVEAQFLTGEFTRAGEFEATLTGGTHAASTGVFCEATTATCCYRRTRR
jgi:hypothetical protein